ncbi:MAG: ferritin-like domain-containing protein [Alphaproteobacteria bacterium]|nr:MAG: ferritin-like domain-containing protein [Alphaproteobacteria bacterium]
MAETKSTKSSASQASSKTTRSGKPASRTKAPADTRQKRAQSVAARTASRNTRSAKENQTDEKGLADLLEHGLKDIYYAERKIYRSLPKMIKAADDAALIEGLTMHREETQGQIETLEAAFEAMGMRPKAEKCDAIDGILAEADTILEDFGGTLAGDAAIIFSARAVEHYEIARYNSLVGFAEALGLDQVQQLLQSILDQETSADAKLTELAEGSINAAASDYDEDASEGETLSATAAE